jgi:fructokinase
LAQLSTDFFGEILVKRLADNHIDVDYLARSDKHSTLAFVQLEQGHEPHYIFYTENSADRSLSSGNMPASLPKEADCLVFGDIAMTMEPVASTIEAFVLREKQNSGRVISFDPNIRPFMIADKAAYVRRFEKWLAASTIAKISEADYAFLYPELGLEGALQRTLECGVRLAIVTLGAKGALAVLHRDDGTTLRVSAPVLDLPVVDTIGAGDTFHGAFLAWLEMRGAMSPGGVLALTEQKLYDALYFANKAASLVCARQGAEPPTLEEINH